MIVGIGHTKRGENEPLNKFMGIFQGLRRICILTRWGVAGGVRMRLGMEGVSVGDSDGVGGGDSSSCGAGLLNRSVGEMCGWEEAAADLWVETGRFEQRLSAVFKISGQTAA